MVGHRPLPYTLPPHTIAWEQVAPGVMRKALWAEPMWNDPSVPRCLSMIRYDPGAKSDLQKQTSGDELVYVIEGVLSDEYGDVAAGNVAYRPAGCVYSQFSRSGVTILSFVVGRIEASDEKPASGPHTQFINVNETPWELGQSQNYCDKKEIWSNPAEKRRMAIFRFGPGFVNELHEHIGDELAYTVEGSLKDEAGVARPGDVGFRPNGCHHSWVSENGGVGLAYIFGGSEYIADGK